MTYPICRKRTANHWRLSKLEGLIKSGTFSQRWPTGLAFSIQASMEWHVWPDEPAAFRSAWPISERETPPARKELTASVLHAALTCGNWL
eukprot:5625863-Alexandrium_andersonii.AAC.1